MADSDLQLFFTKVDGSYPGRHKDLQPIITWKSSTTPVTREFRLPIPVEHSGSVVDYSFETLYNDIQFSVLFSTEDDFKDSTRAQEEWGYAGNEEEKVVAERRRFASHLGPVTGTFHLAGPGRLTLVWDNGHSWFKNKILSYSVTLHVPSLLATERAKCIRAVNALGACVRDRDDSAARAAAAAEEGKETDANVERMEQDLQELQAKLARETERSQALWRESAEMERRNVLETLKMRGLTFRLMPTTVLALTLSFGSEEDHWLCVCKDWKEALQSLRGPPPIGTASSNGSFRAEETAPES